MVVSLQMNWSCSISFEEVAVIDQLVWLLSSLIRSQNVTAYKQGAQYSWTNNLGNLPSWTAVWECSCLTMGFLNCIQQNRLHEDIYICAKWSD